MLKEEMCKHRKCYTIYMLDLSDQIKRYLDLVYHYLSIRSRSEKEVREYLLKKNAESHIINTIIELLKEKKFLDDEAFARSWISQRAVPTASLPQ